MDKPKLNKSCLYEDGKKLNWTKILKARRKVSWPRCHSQSFWQYCDFDIKIQNRNLIREIFVNFDYQTRVGWPTVSTLVEPVPFYRNKSLKSAELWGLSGKCRNNIFVLGKLSVIYGYRRSDLGNLNYLIIWYPLCIDNKSSLYGFYFNYQMFNSGFSASFTSPSSK